MKFLFDTANIAAIREYGEIFPCAGVTSNPTIVKAEGKIDFFAHFRAIRNVIGMERTLHIQILAEDADGMLREARLILEHVDPEVYVKIPATEQGLKAMRILKTQGVRVTATAIYSRMQGFMAIACGADFVAPYCNRMENHDIDPTATIAAFAEMIARCGGETKIVAASFKNIAQVNEALLAGAHAVTVPPPLLREALALPAIRKCVDDFRADWDASQGMSLASLAEVDRAPRTP